MAVQGTATAKLGAIVLDKGERWNCGFATEDGSVQRKMVQTVTRLLQEKAARRPDR
jgi:hypothetical protein